MKNIDKSYAFKKVKQIDKNTGEIIKIWNSIKEAAYNMSVSATSISRSARGKRPTVCGFKWEYN